MSGGDTYRPEELRMYRTVVLVGGTVNMAFWLIHRFLDIQGADPAWQRALLSVACFIVAGMTLGPESVRRQTRWGIQALAYLGTWWWAHRVAASGLRPEFAVGALVPPAIIGLALRRPSHHLSYAVFTVAVSAIEFMGVPAPQTHPLMVVLLMALMLGLSHIHIRTRLRVYDELKASELLRGAMIDQTTDALILVDPVRCEAIEVNARARDLFELPPGVPAGPLAAAVLGNPALTPAQIPEIMRKISDQGIWRWQKTIRTTGGREFTGDLAVSNARLGRHQVWLVRLADPAGRGAGVRGEPSGWQQGPGLESLVRLSAATRGGEYREEELSGYRRVMISGAVLIPVFWFIRRAVGLSMGDPLWQRLVLAGIMLAVAAATLGPPAIRRHVRWGIYGLAFLGTLWWIMRVSATGLRPEYAVSLLVAPAIVGLGFDRAEAHLVYSGMVLIASAIFFIRLPDPATSPVFVITALATMLGLMHLLMRARLRAYNELIASEDLRQTLLEQTTDALVLIDPIRQIALESNGRARALFGAAPGDKPAVLAAAVLGNPTLSMTDIVLTMKSINEFGVFRHDRTWQMAGGRTVTGQLAISAIKLPRRTVWLARVAEAAA